MAEQRIRVRQISTGQIGTMIRGDSHSFTPDPQRLNPFKEYSQLAEYSPILKVAPWILGGELGAVTDASAAGLGLGRGAKILFSRAGREALAKRVLKSPTVRQRAASRAFGRGLGSVKDVVNLGDEVSNLRAVASQTEQGTKLLETAKRGLPIHLQDALTDPALASALAAKDAQELHNAVNAIPGIARELGRTAPEYLNVERPFVEFAKSTGKKIGQLPGMKEVVKAYAGVQQDIRRLKPFLSSESKLAYGGTPIFRRGTGKLIPDLRATGAAGRIFGQRTIRDIRSVRNVKRVAAGIGGSLLYPYIPSFLKRGASAEVVE